MSIVALAVSLATFAFPLIVDRATHWVTAERYLAYLVDVNPRSPYAARGLAADGSHAAQFASKVGEIWEALRESDLGVSDAAPGTVEGGRGTYEVCWPTLEVFPTECLSFANFEFTDAGRIERFTVGAIPIEMLYTLGDETMQLNLDDEPTNVHSRGDLWIPVADPDASTTIVVLALNRYDATDDTILQLESVTAFDPDLEPIGEVAAYFPTVVRTFRDYNAVVRVPESADSVEVCWSGLPDDIYPCDFIIVG